MIGVIIPPCPRCGSEERAVVQHVGQRRDYWCEGCHASFVGGQGELEVFADQRIALQDERRARELIAALSPLEEAQLRIRAEDQVEPIAALGGRRPKPMVDAVMRRIVLEEARAQRVHIEGHGWCAFPPEEGDAS